jgi:hypothetical protein
MPAAATFIRNRFTPIVRQNRYSGRDTIIMGRGREASSIILDTVVSTASARDFDGAFTRLNLALGLPFNELALDREISPFLQRGSEIGDAAASDNAVVPNGFLCHARYILTGSPILSAEENESISY